MVNRLELAKSIIEEQLRNRSGIVGAFVAGSVARGEATQASDIDVALVVDEEYDTAGRENLDMWRQGIYIEFPLFPKKQYADLEKVLRNSVTATHVNDALILYDPEGFLTELQKRVRAVFMEPKWVGVRVGNSIDYARQALSAWGDAFVAGDLGSVCEHAGTVMMGYVSACLLGIGVTPSGTRSLEQLGNDFGELKEKICDLEVATRMTPEDMTAANSIFLKCVPLVPPHMSHLAEDTVKKLAWMATHGLHREAMHTLWVCIGRIVTICRKRDDAAVVEGALAVGREWLRTVGWVGKTVLLDKLETGRAIFKEVVTSAADLLQARNT